MKALQLKIKNYKCFGEVPQGFEQILPINIIIGKNNAGKSSILDMVKAFVNADIFENIKINFPDISIVYGIALTESLISKVYQMNTRGGNITGNNHFEYGQKFIGDNITLELRFDKTRHFIGSTKEMVLPGNTYENLINFSGHPFTGRVIKSINAERDIKEEGNSASRTLDANGSGATALIQEIINAVDLDSSIIELLLLNGLNSITFPEIQFT
jgi:putative ATP-dependent endonuclease of OLD family